MSVEVELHVLFIYLKEDKLMEKENETSPFTIEQFYKFISEKRLMAARCRECGSIFLPPRPICKSCFSTDLMWVQLKTRGKLVAYTIIYVAPQQFQTLAPYAYGIVELENGLRLSGMIRDVEHEEIKIGMDLEVAFDSTAVDVWPKWPRYYFKPP